MPRIIIVHLTWTTFGRLPLVNPPVADFLRAFLPRICSEEGVGLRALGIVRDHVHMIIALPLAFDVPRLVQRLKGASARIANRDGIAGRNGLQWAQGYDLRSVSPRQLVSAIDYVRGQAQRHADAAVR
jgi:REP element-mobilizing transposase RayT